MSNNALPFTGSLFRDNDDTGRGWQRTDHLHRDRQPQYLEQRLNAPHLRPVHEPLPSRNRSVFREEDSLTLDSIPYIKIAHDHVKIIAVLDTMHL